MKNVLLPVLLSSLVGGAVGGVLAATLGSPRAAGGAPVSAATPAELDTLALRLTQIDRRQAELATALEELRLAPAAAARMPADGVATAVERYLASRGDVGPVEELAVQDPAQAPAEVERRQIEDALARLLDPATSRDEAQALWLSMGKQDLSDELVAAFEARVEREPNDPDVRVELGQAYLQKIFEVGSGPMAGVWAMKADGAFNKALELDENHWDARFNKAVSLSFWPPAMGKQNAAIEQFERLLQQQKAQPKDVKYAQSYLFLGNMYQQTGQGDKALATWQQGYALYPENASLADQVALLAKQP